MMMSCAVHERLKWLLLHDSHHHVAEISGTTKCIHVRSILLCKQASESRIEMILYDLFE